MLPLPDPARDDRSGDGSADSGPTVLDPQALAQLRALDPGGAVGLLPRVAGLYEQSLDKLLPQLDQVEAAADWPTLRGLAHTLKSSSGSLGALKLAQLCADIEHAVRDGRTGDLPQRLRQLRAEIARVRPAVAALRGG